MLKTAILIGFATTLAAPCLAQTRPLTSAEKATISAKYGAGLKAPLSAQYKWHQVPLADSVKGGQVGYCFEVNAKNSYGGYTGYKLIMGTLRRSNGRVVAFDYVMGNIDDTPELLSATADLCKGFGISF